MDEANEGGSSNDLPWASVFNPAANVRAFSAIQADGFRAASELVERFVRIASTESRQQRRIRGSARRRAVRRTGRRSLRRDRSEPLVTSWWAMADQFLRVSAPRGERSRGTGGDVGLRDLDGHGRAPAGGRGAGHGDHRGVAAQRRTDRPWQGTAAVQRPARARRGGDSGCTSYGSSPTSSRCPHAAVEG